MTHSDHKRRAFEMASAIHNGPSVNRTQTTVVVALGGAPTPHFVATPSASNQSSHMCMLVSPQTGSVLHPDLTQARRFLDILASSDSPVTFQTFSDDKRATNIAGLIRVLHGTLDNHADTLIRLNQRGAGIFIMVNDGDGYIHGGAKSCRTAENVIRVRAHVLDLDGTPLQPILDCDAPPHMVVESSAGRWHVYWLVDDCPLEEFGARQDALNERFDADRTVQDLPRVLRLPGFFNHKHGTPEMVRLVAPPESGDR